jgi:hypothetical protein
MASEIYEFMGLCAGAAVTLYGLLLCLWAYQQLRAAWRRLRGRAGEGG